MKDKVALVTGGSKGMGEAAVRIFAEKGASVAILDVDIEAAEKLSAELNENGANTIAIKCDVSSEAQVEKAIAQVVETYGKLDAAFNNAGIQIPAQDITETSEEDYDKILNVNLKGVWLCMKHELIQMKKQQSGAIVNNSSLAGKVGVPGRTPYVAAKHAILGITKSAAADYASQGIRINAVCPGTIETPMVNDMVNSGDLKREDSINAAPINRLGKASEVADAAVWLCGEESTYVIGQSIAVDGGYTIL
ncbi:NAD(P)-dependent dehydrogenase, short-chain alcohol dehydrogenase family [Zunongwangia mangrovi]|uniref:NAD(P)-dependent dehydrogenase, short-chain alcohol dehydrogenase family n=1 Tax=Zunongwangia mangrovi TaxID=1334022 RepID=A0A1I1J754_9FLAO|nr:glucose 1-dehydrogenase [Zunongwangia mangrovi]SFC43951.1 NAD(P)-dependent dehydrogenase, short-chain alcohol dehydrogenase family [Zunongwangia mangrovi]